MHKDTGADQENDMRVVAGRGWRVLGNTANTAIWGMSGIEGCQGSPTVKHAEAQEHLTEGKVSERVFQALQTGPVASAATVGGRLGHGPGGGCACQSCQEPPTSAPAVSGLASPGLHGLTGQAQRHEATANGTAARVRGHIRVREEGRHL